MKLYPTLLEFSLGRKKDTTVSWLMNCITQKPYQIFLLCISYSLTYKESSLSSTKEKND